MRVGCKNKSIQENFASFNSQQKILKAKQKPELEIPVVFFLLLESIFSFVVFDESFEFSFAAMVSLEKILVDWLLISFGLLLTSG